MSKFQSGLIQEITADAAYQAEQQKLKEKNNITDENVVVVEKRDAAKFIVKLFIRFVKFIAASSLFVLATIGVFTLVYSQLREPFIIIIQQILKSIF